MVQGLSPLLVAFAVATGGVILVIVWAAGLLSRRQERRKHIRERLAATRGHVAFGGRRTPCAIIDISAGGAQLVPDQDIPIGAAIRLEVTRYGTIPGKVVRKHKSAVGVAFDRELTETALMKAGSSTDHEQGQDRQKSGDGGDVGEGRVGRCRHRCLQ